LRSIIHNCALQSLKIKDFQAHSLQTVKKGMVIYMFRILTKLPDILQDHLYRNSIFLVLSRGLNATAGILFWVIAAKLYTITEVGMATVLISSLGLVMLFSRFGFDLSLIRYLEITGKNKVFNTSLAITTIASAVISLISIIFIGIFRAESVFNFINAMLFIVIALCNSITLITGNMLLALRKGQYFFIQTVLISLRLFLLFPLAYSKSFGIFLSLGICYVLSSVFSLWVLRKEIKINIHDIDRAFVKESFKFSIGSYISNLLTEAPVLILPIMVLQLIGEKEAAIYYIAMAIGNIALIVPNALSISLFIEGSHGSPLKRIITKAFTTAYLFLIPLTLIISLWGKNILGFIDKEYIEAYNLLLFVIISSMFVVIYMVFLSVQSINMRVDRNVKFNVLRFLLLIGASFYLIPRYQIIGVGYAWLFTHVILTLIIAVTFVKTAIMRIAGRCKEEYMKITKWIRSWWMNRMKFNHSTNQYVFTQKAFLILICIFAVLGSAVPILLTQYNLFILGIYLVIPMLAAPIIWRSLRTRNNIVFSISSNLNEFFILCFFACCLISILILYIFPVRIILYYILIAVMGVMILTQILYTEKISSKQSKLILIQIILLFLNIIWGVTLKYYFFIGRTDELFHSWALENLLQTGFIDQTFENYEAFPLWHILCSFIYQIMNLPFTPAQVMFITNGLIYGCLVIVIYLVALKFFNVKIALLSALFICFNIDAVFYGMYSIPRSTVFFLEGILFFLLIQKKTYLNSVLCLLVTVGLIMYHTASMPFILLILVLIYFLQSVYRIDKSERFVTLNFILLFFVSGATYLMYSGTEVFNSISGSLLQKAPTGVLTQSIVVKPLQELFNYLQYSPLLLFIILGVIWGLDSLKLNGFAKLILIISLLLVPVSFPGPALLLNKLAGNFNLMRFGEYSFLFFCIAGAAGISFIFYKLKTKLLAVILFFIMAFLAVSNDFTASDNPIVKRPFYTFYLNEEESKSMNRVAQIADGIVMSDYVACRYLENSVYADKVNVLEVDPQQQEFLRSGGNDIILIRSTELANRPLKLFTSPNGEFLLTPTIGDKMDYYTNDLPLWDTLESCNVIYDSGDIRGFQ
jgi:O-antigen/teichoic acid export membrane protein